MLDQPVLYAQEGAVAILTLNRPERLNAWTPGMNRAYFRFLERAAADPSIRAIVVTGAGRGFCAGGDMAEMGDLASGTSTYDPGAYPQSYPLSIPKPIIAAINGGCAGIGFAVALMCDLRVAARGAKLTTAFARRGLNAEHASSWLLPRIIGHARALDLLLSGRVVLAEEAFELGLVNRLVAPEHLRDEVLAYATELATRCSPASMAMIKRQVVADWQRDLPAALAEADRLMLAAHASLDMREGVASFVERRPPHFAPLTATDSR